MWCLAIGNYPSVRQRHFFRVDLNHLVPVLQDCENGAVVTPHRSAGTAAEVDGLFHFAVIGIDRRSVPGPAVHGIKPVSRGVVNQGARIAPQGYVAKMAEIGESENGNAVVGAAGEMP